MSFDFSNDPRFSLEGISRQAADELIDCIVWNAKSEADVASVIEQIIGYMRAKWAEEEWSLHADEFGKDASARADAWPSPFDDLDGGDH